MEEYSRILSEFVSEFDADDIPADALERTRQSILNATATALSASRADPVGILLEVLLADGGGEGTSRLVGRPERLGLLNAVLLNAYMAHYDDYDDTHRATGIHTNPTTVPVLLGLGAARHVSGEDGVAALTLGLEGAIRLGLGIGRSHATIGWHTTGTIGTVGAALTASRLLGMDARRTNYALGLALTQAAGLRGQMFGTMAKGFNAAKAAYNGLLGALLAERGFTAAENGIEGSRAYATAASRDAELKRITEGLGSTWETPRIGFKPYASGAATHAGIDAVLGLRRELGLDDTSSPEEVARRLGEIKGLELTVHPGAVNLPRGRHIESPFEAKFSMYNVAAIVLVRGRGGPGEYNEAVLTDPVIARIRDLVELVGDPEVENGTAFLVAELDGGRRIEVRIDRALGTIARPLDDAALRKKLADAAAGVLGSDALARLTEALEQIAKADDLAKVTELVGT